ncbi:hypothetical protein [Synechococcus sp. PCC 7336]|uniref:hypothetical protein n=1 Tax=Synechococcus sp. PCC 7336 TaxID=195250 RepID=UPI0003480D00|nr:hypothetical protein [Synechococcus sp. PCC 7336]
MGIDLLSDRAINTAIPMTLFFAIAWGLMFKDMLEYEVQRWDANRETQDRVEYNQPRIFFTYAVTCLLLLAFSIYCLLAIGFPANIASGIAASMVGFTGILIWVQLGALLKELVEGGSEALQIDAD